MLLLNFDYFSSFFFIIFSITYPFLLSLNCLLIAVSSIFYNFLFPSHLLYPPFLYPPSQPLFTSFLLVTDDSLFPPYNISPFLHHFHLPRFSLFIVCSLTHTRAHTVTPYPLPNSQSLLPTCSKISPQACAFAYSSIQLFTRTSQPTSTHPFCHLDVSIRACARSASPVPRNINSRPPG